MSTSRHEGLIRRNPLLTEPFAGAGIIGPALTATLAGDYVFNNLQHMADEYAQVRMTMANSSYLEMPEAPADDTYYLLATSGAFPIPLRQSGETYALRIRIGGSTSAVGQVDFRAILCPPSLAAAYAEDTTSLVDWIWDGSTTSTSATWLSGATLGSAASPTLLTVDATTAAGWFRMAPTLTDLAGDATTVDQCMVALHIFGRSADTGARLPRLYAAYAAEWIGDPA